MKAFVKSLLWWIFGGLVLGGLIHLVVILTLPGAAIRDIWHRFEEIVEDETLVVLADIVPGALNPLGLDPELLYGICMLDLSDGPGFVGGSLPLAFWSVSVFDRQGHVLYSTTNRSVPGGYIDMGLFNPSQIRLLTEQGLEIEEGLLIVETRGNEAAVAIRLAPPHAAMRSRYRDMLAGLGCEIIR